MPTPESSRLASAGVARPAPRVDAGAASYLVQDLPAGAPAVAALAPLAEGVLGRPGAALGRATGLYADRRDAGRLLLVVEWRGDDGPSDAESAAWRRTLAADAGDGGAPAWYRTLYLLEDMSGGGDVVGALPRRVAAADRARYRAWEVERLRGAAVRPGVVALALLGCEERPGEHLLLGAFADADARERYVVAADDLAACPVPVLRADAFVGVAPSAWSVAD